MRFAPSPEQRKFARSLHDLLSDAGVPAVARAAGAGDPGPGHGLWRRLADVGLPALAVPDRWGGLDAGPGDLVVAFEELGHHAVPGPLPESAVAAPALLTGLARSRPELSERWLPELADGDRLLTVTHPLCPYAVGARWADAVLAVHGDELRQVPGEALQPQRSVDPARDLASVTDPRGGELLASGPEVAAASVRAAELGTLAVAAQLLGAARMLLETSVEYAGQRVQFGRRIGEYQAVKHHLADLAVAVEFTRPLVYGAAVSLRTAEPTAARDVSAAKVAASRAADRAARSALQVHGAVGYTREHDLSVWLLMIRALVGAWGTAGYHRRRVLRSLAGETSPAPEPAWESVAGPRPENPSAVGPRPEFSSAGGGP